MRESCTPSTRSRISLYTIAILALGDGFTFMTFLLVSFFAGEEVWVTLMFTAFLAFVSVSFFGMRFMMDLWNAQAPEREARRREDAEEIHRRERVYLDVRNRLIRERQARLARQADGGGGGEVAVGLATGDGVADAVADMSTTLPDSTDGTMPSADDGSDADSQQPSLTQPIADSLPLPVTAQPPLSTGATPVFMPSDQAGLEPITGQPGVLNPQIIRPILHRESFGSVYTKFYLLLLFTLFLTLNATSWPTALRKFYFSFLGLVYLSFWLPQIYRNVLRNCRKALNWEFVLGQSLLRLAPFAYFYGYGGNVLFVEPDYGSLGAFAAYLALEVLVLGSQELVGPRWFVGKGWVEPAYDYHPILREDEEDATRPVGFSRATSGSPVAERSPIETRGSRSGSATSPTLQRPRQNSRRDSRRSSVATKDTRGSGKRVFDCAICMQELEVPVLKRDSSGGENLTGPLGLLARRAYMVTPCRHVFHSACLEGWMKFRLVCPVCRETLPPL